jgi:divalent metal cation (Fe/Co/Zn/Cd) transporter
VSNHAQLRTPERVARARWLEYITLTWNVVEAGVAITAGVLAGSIALIGFGLDSIVESFSAAVVLWEFRGVSEERERRALRLIAVSFYMLAAYVTIEAARDLIWAERPGESVAGMALVGTSLVLMPLLARAKRRLGIEMHSATLVADAKETALCAYLSGVLLGGLLLNATLGWWWADPMAALFIAWQAVKEGREAWEGERCECD